ncbi:MULTISPECIES: DUF1036 domain-containing protein [Streptomyces]|nr:MULTISPECIES: DUF1036 domain-containing protein [Streptomyces]MYS96813.1 DUF1036 domain-containing protein [Streptomyces sp. SID5469]BBJ48824.1 hypothetical protein SAVMC3_14530 [Streptomyces avermitilis]GDY60866.1 hypothetical protein SAV14893_002590 [Streptomyces avermitilis]GDY79056.1 hypothetical protein SAV31267_085410 [Streptomyces avermitilis]GDY88103.1 hypothetical protein SAVCW2_73020 [Streptomyces avermitilis]
MSLNLKNNYHQPVWAMVEWHHPNCSDGGDWMKKGWWKIGPGQTSTVFGDDVHAVNPIWYCYAHSSDGLEWRDRFQELVPTHAFEWCSNTADTSSRTILMNEFVVSRPNHVHTFLAP